MRKTPPRASAAKAVTLAECTSSVEALEDADGAKEAAAVALEVMSKIGVDEFILDSNVVAKGAVKVSICDVASCVLFEL